MATRNNEHAQTLESIDQDENLAHHNDTAHDSTLSDPQFLNEKKTQILLNDLIQEHAALLDARQNPPTLAYYPQIRILTVTCLQQAIQILI